MMQMHLAKAASADGNMDCCNTVDDVTVDKELVVAGEFHDKNDPSKDIYRKFAPYTQDAGPQNYSKLSH